MKIIKRKRPEDKVFPMKITCKQIKDKYGYVYGEARDFCGSKLEIEPKDIKKHEWHKYPNYSGTDYVVVCPVCHNFIVINEKLLSTQIKNNAKEVWLRRR